MRYKNKIQEVNEVFANPLAEIDVKLVEGDMSCGDENFLDERVDSLQNSEIEKLGALLVEIRHQLSVLRHFWFVSVQHKP